PIVQPPSYSCLSSCNDLVNETNHVLKADLFDRELVKTDSVHQAVEDWQTLPHFIPISSLLISMGRAGVMKGLSNELGQHVFPEIGRVERRPGGAPVQEKPVEAHLGKVLVLIYLNKATEPRRVHVIAKFPPFHQRS